MKPNVLFQEMVTDHAKKTEEKRLLEAIIPAELRPNAMGNEAPDFVCFDNEGPFIGFELTELFASQSSARLSKRRNYLVDILDSREYLHVEDIQALPVVSFTWSQEKNEHKLNGILQKVPSVSHAVECLTNCIRRKAAKIDEYKTKASSIDLVVVDTGGVFRIEKEENVGLLLHNPGLRSAILKSGFREIWLVLNIGSKMAGVLCRTNIFAEEISKFNHAFNELRKKSELSVSCRQVFEMLAAYLKNREIPGATVIAAKDKYAVFSDCAGCFIGTERVDLFAITPRITPRSKLVGNLNFIEACEAHPLYPSICVRCSQMYHWYNIHVPCSFN